MFQSTHKLGQKGFRVLFLRRGRRPAKRGQPQVVHRSGLLYKQDKGKKPIKAKARGGCLRREINSLR
jgi:hypothetical protein